MQLIWAENVVRHTNGRVLILTPLAVVGQTLREAAKFDIEAERWNPEAKANILITNYEKLHLLSSTDFVGIVCDESSILKHFGGATQKAITRFAAKMSYRLLCTATAAPNDWDELGTSSEALGSLGYSDMLTRFFKMDDNKRCRMNDVKSARAANSGNHFAKLSYRVSQQIGAWRLKGHAEESFWRWVCSWARACRRPSDLGFDDSRFALPELIERDHIIDPKRPAPGMLFTRPALGLKEEREERNRTLDERCELVRQLATHDKPVVVWCHFNKEGDLLAKLLPEFRQISGATPDDEKEEIYNAFGAGKLRGVITKPKIGAWGLNWQHCSHVITFASHSYEQYYQSVRRCWRFGQLNPVTVDVIATTGEEYVLGNMRRKSEAAEKMFAALVAQMNNALHCVREDHLTKIEVPEWLS